MGALRNNEMDSLLKQTSRSFYLTMKVLPKSSREQIGLLYLLARTADTIADTNQGEASERIHALERFRTRTIQGEGEIPDFTSLAAMQEIPAEKELLEQVTLPVAALDSMNQVDKRIMRKCLKTIIGGQILDLERFGSLDEGEVQSLQTISELDDYAYRVAGCVGEFWTDITTTRTFSIDASERNRFFELAIRFGKALQYVNILRDIAEDLRLGRCYIPSDMMAEAGLSTSDLSEPSNFSKFEATYHSLLDDAADHFAAAVEYVGMVPHRQYRVRLACMLPIIIGQRTLAMLRTANVLDPNERVKVDRTEIKSIRNRCIWALPSRKRSNRLLNEVTGR